jgi:hypothetical protein
MIDPHLQEYCRVSDFNNARDWIENSPKDDTFPKVSIFAPCRVRVVVDISHLLQKHERVLARNAKWMEVRLFTVFLS